MPNQKLDHDKKKALVILDFDGTIFYNPTSNFSLNIPLDYIIDAYTFFNEFTFQTNETISNKTEFVLITGRSQEQEAYIKHLLETRGFRIDQSFFNQMGITTAIDESSFLIKYWTAKVKLINEFRLNKEYKSIIVIEDSHVICSMLQKLNFKVYQAEITKYSPTQTLTVRFRPPQTRSMTELETLLKPREKQNESLIEIV